MKAEVSVLSNRIRRKMEEKSTNFCFLYCSSIQTRSRLWKIPAVPTAPRVKCSEMRNRRTPQLEPIYYVKPCLTISTRKQKS